MKANQNKEGERTVSSPLGHFSGDLNREVFVIEVLNFLFCFAANSINQIDANICTDVVRVVF
jgi:hypothetical protein